MLILKWFVVDGGKSGVVREAFDGYWGVVGLIGNDWMGISARFCERKVLKVVLVYWKSRKDTVNVTYSLSKSMVISAGRSCWVSSQEKRTSILSAGYKTPIESDVSPLMTSWPPSS